MTVSVRVDLADRGYDVVVGPGVLQGLGASLPIPAGARRAALVTQAPVAERYADVVEHGLREAGLQPRRFVIPDGESAKTLEVLGGLLDRFALWPLGRGDVVVALGGGVVGDLAGFAAAVWNRGVPVAQLPTTLLAMVDAAVGGKTGVNLATGKNLVGAFHQPIAVLADVDTLATLDRRIRVEAFGEIVKYGLIRDPSILDLVERDVEGARSGERALLTDLVHRSVAVKAAVVAADERESGERAHLNLGHTYGHALETLTGYGEVLHGEAVAIGTCLALRVGARLGRTPADLVVRAEGLFERLGLPTRAPRVDRDDAWRVMQRDKKAAAAGVRFVLLDGLAAPTVVRVDRPTVDEIIDEIEA